MRYYVQVRLFVEGKHMGSGKLPASSYGDAKTLAAAIAKEGEVNDKQYRDAQVLLQQGPYTFMEREIDELSQVITDMRRDLIVQRTKLNDRKAHVPDVQSDIGGSMSS